MIRRMLVSILGLATAMIASSAFAGESSGAFYAPAASETPYIATDAYKVYNIDATAPHSVAVSLGRYAPGVHTFTFYGSTQGNAGTMTCAIYGIAVPGLASAFAQATTGSPAFPFAVPITLGGSQSWDVSAVCTFPKSVPNSFVLYGWN